MRVRESTRVSVGRHEALPQADNVQHNHRCKAPNELPVDEHRHLYESCRMRREEEDDSYHELTEKEE